MVWPEHHLTSWKEFTNLAEKLDVGEPHLDSFLFRGQSNKSWTLKPSLLRLFADTQPQDEILSVEKSLLRASQLRIQVSFGTSLASLDTYAKWVLLQQHGAPTRLLDWTRSPYVAAYFAVQENWGVDGALWLVHMNPLQKAMVGRELPRTYPDDYSDSDSDPDTLFLIDPPVGTDRIIAQAACFSVSARPHADHSDVIDRLISDQQGGVGNNMHKLTIPSAQKSIFLRNLRAMNISATSLFPGADGLGKSLTELARLAAAYYLE